MSATHDKKAEAERQVVDLILANFARDGIAMMTEEQKIDYLSASLCASYQILRGVVGNEWMEGWLGEALNEVRTTPAWVQIRKPS
ncbi:hypothetical protein [Paraburkholderia tropica]|uniref:hypothetical protein n=1 Tax=Paraburkholderia tropica TaxID=92647 RepID=UPI002AB7B2B0|nr:hypothetical protein [Paraburkholderia tropica]